MPEWQEGVRQKKAWRCHTTGTRGAKVLRQEQGDWQRAARGLLWRERVRDKVGGVGRCSGEAGLYPKCSGGHWRTEPAEWLELVCFRRLPLSTMRDGLEEGKSGSREAAKEALRGAGHGMLVAGAGAAEEAVVRWVWSRRDAFGELPGLTDGDWVGGGKGKESLTSRTLTTGKMEMPPPEMEKTWGMDQRGWKPSSVLVFFVWNIW